MESSDIELCWATMPLSEEELSKIPSGHDFRPYLLLKEGDGFYWAFPSTSKAFSNKNRYVNGTLRVNGFSNIKSLVMLDKIYKLPFDNLAYHSVKIVKREENQLIKRLKANIKFCNYPDEVIEFINSRSSYLEQDDMIEHESELYVIIGKVTNRDIFYSLRVYNHEVRGTIFKEVDTNKYYVDCSRVYCILPNETTKYVSVMRGLSSGKFEKDKDDLKKTIQQLQSMKKVSSRLTESDFKVFGRLPIGTVISYTQDDGNYKMIILKRDCKDTTVMFGLENQIYRDFQVGVFPNSYNFSFTIISTLNDDRVNSLRESKLNNKPYSYKKYQD